MENEFDDLDISTQEEEVETEEVDTETEEQIDWKAKALKAEEIAENQRIRAEKAERKAKDVQVAPKQSQSKVSQEISTKDLYALIEAKVPEADIDDVRDYAAFKKISISEALKSNFVKQTLAEKAEERQTAIAANVGSSKRGTGKLSDDVILSKASKGELPENDDDIMRLVRARKGLK